MWQAGGHRVHHQRHLVPQEIRLRRAAALVRDVADVDLGRRLEHLGRQVLRAADARAGIGQVARLGARLLHQLLERVDARGRRGQEHQRHREHARHRREIVRQLVVHGLVQRLVHRRRAARDHERVAVGRRARRLLHADIAAGSGPVFNHHRLLHRRAQLFSQRAGEDVGRLPRGTARSGAGDGRDTRHAPGRRRPPAPGQPRGWKEYVS